MERLEHGDEQGRKGRESGGKEVGVSGDAKGCDMIPWRRPANPLEKQGPGLPGGAVPTSTLTPHPPMVAPLHTPPAGVGCTCRGAPGGRVGAPVTGGWGWECLQDPRGEGWLQRPQVRGCHPQTRFCLGFTSRRLLIPTPPTPPRSGNLSAGRTPAPVPDGGGGQPRQVAGRTGSWPQQSPGTDQGAGPAPAGATVGRSGVRAPAPPPPGLHLEACPAP
ncbi:hypothetical protein VULLAG_LOCUS14336 [Vulpes lagopus]